MSSVWSQSINMNSAQNERLNKLRDKKRDLMNKIYEVEEELRNLQEDLMEVVAEEAQAKTLLDIQKFYQSQVLLAQARDSAYQ